MPRLLPALALLVAGAAAAAAPVPKEKKPPAPKLEGTTWSGDGVVAPTTYTFEKDGTLVYSYNGQTYTSGSWKQEGARVYWETNNRYCEFEGTVKGSEMAGKAWNVTGGKWELKMKRDPDKAPPPKP
jgi:opacity protein-like surface antigen